MGIPISTFAISLVIDGKPVLGVVYDPFTDRMYWAIEGAGAFINSKEIHVSTARTLDKNYVVLSGRMGDSNITTGEYYDKLMLLGGKPFSLRTYIYGLMMVARGDAVGSVAGYFKPWDIAAPLLILNEAGAMVTDYDGNPASVYSVDNGLIASNGNVHNELLKLLRKSSS